MPAWVTVNAWPATTTTPDRAAPEGLAATEYRRVDRLVGSGAWYTVSQLFVLIPTQWQGWVDEPGPEGTLALTLPWRGATRGGREGFVGESLYRQGVPNSRTRNVWLAI